MEIFEKDRFGELPEEFWTGWLAKMREEIVTTSYPLTAIRVCSFATGEEEAAFKAMFDAREERKDSTFHHEFEAFGTRFLVHLNMVYWYCGADPTKL